MSDKLPNVCLTQEIVKGSSRVSLTRRCAKNYIGQDVQSNEGQLVRCSSRSVIQIQLPTGQLYDLCESHALELGVDLSPKGELRDE